MKSMPNFKAKPVAFKALNGWGSDNQAEALSAFRRSCKKLLNQPDSKAFGPAYGTMADWKPACRAALKLGKKVSAQKARKFFESYFFPLAISGPGGRKGLFTGYYEPEVAGSLKPGKIYNVPIYRKPDALTLQGGTPKPHAIKAATNFNNAQKSKSKPTLSREQIDKGSLENKGLEIAYIKSRLDAFFIHIQGSARIRLRNGKIIRIAFDAKNGHPYTSIGRVLINRGTLEAEKITMQSLHRWLRTNPDKANKILWRNKSYIFFREVELKDDKLGAPGAANVQLTPGRSLAVDRRYHGLGMPIWLETEIKLGRKPVQKINRLMIAQDTGSAILGPIRGDYFWGTGPEAGKIAGNMKNQGQIYVLLPKSLKLKFTKKTSK